MLHYRLSLCVIELHQNKLNLVTGFHSHELTFYWCKGTATIICVYTNDLYVARKFFSMLTKGKSL